MDGETFDVGKGPESRLVGDGPQDPTGSLSSRVRLLETELARARADLARLDAVEVERQLLMRELEDLRTSRAWADQSAVEKRAADADSAESRESTHRTVSYRLGSAILSAGRSRAALVRLPATLVTLRREVVEQRRQRRKVNSLDASQVWYAEQTLKRATEAGVEQALAWLARQDMPRERRGELIVQVARDLIHRSPEVAFSLALEALHLQPSSTRARWVAFALFDLGFVAHPNRLLRVADLRQATPAELRKTDHIKSLRIEDRPAAQVRRSAAGVRASPKTLLLVANHSYPHHVTSQTLRDQATAVELGRRGWRTVIATEQAYHAGKERGPRIVEQTAHDQEFIRLAATDTAVGDYAALSAHAAHQLVLAIEKVRPSCVVATGDVIMAEAALQAARRCGAPFVHDVAEVRAPWKTPVRRELSDERSEALLALTAAVARQADQVVVRGRVLAEALQARGVPGELLRVLPDPELWPEAEPGARIASTWAELDGATVLGSLADEVSPSSGFLELVEALAEAGGELVAPALLVGGVLHQGDLIRDRLQHVWPSAKLVAPGRPSGAEIVALANALDVWIEPSPLTGYGGLSAPAQLQLPLRLGLPVVAPDLPAIRERLGVYRNAHFYRSHDFEGLREALAAALAAGRGAGVAASPVGFEWPGLYEAVLQGDGS
jgi:glycosyltransferase involved in cell wall biosynthesis